MRGGPTARGLVGVSFQFVWKEKTLADLYTAMRDKMPPGDAGGLDQQVYADLVATILEHNEFPPGERELKPDAEALQSIRITWDAPAK